MIGFILTLIIIFCLIIMVMNYVDKEFDKQNTVILNLQQRVENMEKLLCDKASATLLQNIYDEFFNNTLIDKVNKHDEILKTLCK